MAEQNEDPALAAKFKPFAEAMKSAEQKIIAELSEVQGQPASAIKGYFHARREDVKKVMRPSATLNAILANAPVANE